ncbi:Ubiquitin conjugation factor E4 A [Lamellibrachia satsuma]|nr:Ubiquitin conjugation factor E4 A [Lamellibrachia satsuma]
MQSGWATDEEESKYGLNLRRMDDQGLDDNPFATLTHNVDQSLSKPIPESCSSEEPENVAQETKHITVVDNLIEQVFLLTLDKEPFHERVPQCVYLEGLHNELDKQTWIDTNTLHQALFERLMLDSPLDHVIVTSQRSDLQSAQDVAEPDTLRYLFQCYSRLVKQTPVKPDLRDMCQSAIVGNAKLSFQHPELFASLDIPAQFMPIFTDSPDIATDFFRQVAEAVDREKEEETLFDCFRPILDSLKASVKEDRSLSRSSSVFQCLDIVLFFAQHNLLAEVLVKYNELPAGSPGRAYEGTLLGAVLSVSCVPQSEAGPYEFFDQPSRSSKQEHDITETNIHLPMGLLTERMHQVFYSLLRHKGDSRHRTLCWLGQCLHANKDRAKLWSNQMPQLLNQLCSDGFSLNLCTVLLRLCQPFAQPGSVKMLEIQPTYCLATVGDACQLTERGVHLTDLSDTPLIPTDSQQVAPVVEANYNFMTDIYFMCHYALGLSFRVMHEKLLKLDQHLNRMQGVMQDLSSMPAPLADLIKEQMKEGMTRLLCMKAALTQTQMLELCFDFNIASARWLIQVATSRDLTQFHSVTFPLSKNVPQVLACVPEFIAENIIDFLLFLRRFKDSLFQFAGEKLEHMMSFVLVFMGSPDRMNNPHLRAKLAEALEFLKPPDDTSSSVSAISSSEREALFRKHPLAAHVAETLLHVFVSIEMTGQGVEFEQKFNYRRPMYAVLRYIWTMELHRDALKRLAADAEEHIEATDPPLFLRFINLLMNDAIFLLDEALSYMAQIKEKQAEQEWGDWERLSASQ